jgi:hypothetical protein
VVPRPEPIKKEKADQVSAKRFPVGGGAYAGTACILTCLSGTVAPQTGTASIVTLSGAP